MFVSLENKEKSIQAIVVSIEKIMTVFTCPDLAEWRKLNIPIAQLKSLVIIANSSNVKFSSLAQELDVTPGNVTGIVDRMVEQGLVNRNPDPQDRRIVWLEATEKGKQLLGSLREYHPKQMSAMLSFMNEDELKALAIGMNGLARVFNEHIAEFKNVGPEHIHMDINQKKI